MCLFLLKAKQYLYRSVIHFNPPWRSSSSESGDKSALEGSVPAGQRQTGLTFPESIINRGAAGTLPRERRRDSA
jgi:hypothetical protein